MRRYLVSIGLLFIVGAVMFLSCAKYKDPKGYTDPRLTNPYCNDPNAVNFNVGFPGKPDNTLCIYPRDLFVGKWLFHDSVTIESGPNAGLFIFADSFIMTISAVPNSLTKILATGFCGNVGISLTAGPTYIATVDTTVGDSVTINEGQYFCRTLDTVSGTFTKSFVDSTLIMVQLQVVSDTGVTTHAGTARRQ